MKPLRELGLVSGRLNAITRRKNELYGDPTLPPFEDIPGLNQDVVDQLHLLCLEKKGLEARRNELVAQIERLPE